MKLDKNKKTKNNIRFIIFMGIGLFFVMALRDTSVGTDIMGYRIQYEDDMIFRKHEPAFSYLNHILRLMNFSFQQYLAIISLIVVFSVSKLCYKYSKNIFLSFYLYCTIGLFAMSLSGLRQTLAVCVIILAFIYMVNNKLIPFLLSVCCAYLVHNSAIIFIPMYLLRNIKINRIMAIVIYAISVSTFFIKDYIVIIAEYFTPQRLLKYFLVSDTISVNPLVILVNMAIPLACIFFWSERPNISDKDKRVISIVFIFSCISIVLSNLSLELKMTERLIYYFSTFNMILIPNVIENIKNYEIKLTAKIVCFILPLIQFTISIPGGSMGIDNYKFFW